MRIKKPNIVKITTPIKLSESKIKEYIIKNYEFILKSLLVSSPNYEFLHFLGKEYRFKVIIDLKPRVEINEDFIYIYAQNDNQRTIQRAVDLFYTTALSNIVETNIDEIKNKFNIKFDISFGYKNVRSYFGECFPKRRNVILATRLAKYDLKYILSVIYHELAHFYYMNHSDVFYNFLENIYPNYRKVQKELRRIKFLDIY
ncbi:MAG: M48 family metallopeptidase [Anaeroplasma sp.]